MSYHRHYVVRNVLKNRFDALTHMLPAPPSGVLRWKMDGILMGDDWGKINVDGRWLSRTLLDWYPATKFATMKISVYVFVEWSFVASEIRSVSDSDCEGPGEMSSLVKLWALELRGKSFRGYAAQARKALVSHNSSPSRSRSIEFFRNCGYIGEPGRYGALFSQSPPLPAILPFVVFPHGSGAMHCSATTSKRF